MNPANQQTTASLGYWATQNPLVAVGIVVLIIGCLYAIYALARGDDKHEDDE